MKRKLNEMNKIIGDIIEKMDNNTILFIMGDHGMTEDGNHGGATSDETKTILFAFSKKKFNKFIKKHQEINHYEINQDHVPIVNQIDFVPTFSMLFGIPIPYSNLGYFF